MSIFKRPWARRPAASEAKRVDPTPVADLAPPVPPPMTATGRDFSRFEGHDVRLKFWLPDLMDTALAELEEAMRVSRSTLVRMTLFQYLYGRYDYVAMQVHDTGFFRSAARWSKVQFSQQATRGGRTPELRKNLNDVSVFLPQCMKDDLLASSQALGIQLSVHVREILISELLGRLRLPDRTRFTAVPADRDLASFESVGQPGADAR